MNPFYGKEDTFSIHYCLLLLLDYCEYYFRQGHVPSNFMQVLM